jgi:hypothetical protein
MISVIVVANMFWGAQKYKILVSIALLADGLFFKNIFVPQGKSNSQIK